MLHTLFETIHRITKEKAEELKQLAQKSSSQQQQTAKPKTNTDKVEEVQQSSVASNENGPIRTPANTVTQVNKPQNIPAFVPNSGIAQLPLFNMANFPLPQTVMETKDDDASMATLTVVSASLLPRSRLVYPCARMDAMS